MRTRNPKLFEASYSTLSAWERGDWDRAIRSYFGLDVEVTEAMEAGKKWHKIFENEVKASGCYPKVFGGRRIGEKYQTELRYEKKIDDWLQLNGVIDLLTETAIIDYKTGVSSASGHIRQLRTYQIFCPDKKIGIIKHYNQHNGLVESVYYHLTEQTLRDSYNWLITNASEMFQYLEENNIYKLVEEKYGKI